MEDKEELERLENAQPSLLPPPLSSITSIATNVPAPKISGSVFSLDFSNLWLVAS